MNIGEKRAQEKKTGKTMNGKKQFEENRIKKNRIEENRIEEVRWEKSVRAEVWKKGKQYVDYSPKVLRLDRYGRIMMYSKFERTDSKFGWTIETIDPSGNIGPIDINNLEPVNIGYSEK